MRQRIAIFLAFVLSFFSVSAFAAIDVSGAVTEISGLAAPIAAIGGAVLIVSVIIMGWKKIRHAM